MDRASTSRMLAALVALAAACGCDSAPGYLCLSNAQCIDSDGTQGICEASEYCSFPDSSCTDSNERYDSSAGAGLANSCVGAGATSCVSSIAVGVQFSCFVRSDGTVWCWGNNADGELGDGTTTMRLVPARVLGLPDPTSLPAISVTAAEQHACALISDGTVYCWGINDASNLGQCAGTITKSTRALQVPAWTAGATPACAIPAAPFVAMLPSGNVAKTLSAGGEHTCAIGADGDVYCWGENTTGGQGGQAGQDFTMLPNVPGPLIITGSSPDFTNHVLDVEVGDDFSCLAKDDLSAWCWGGNQLGELATGGTAQSITPVAIAGFGDVSQLVTDDETGCVLAQPDDVWCWGNGADGIFGLAGNDSSNSETPVSLTSATGLFGGPTADTVCLTGSNGDLQCWGANGSGEAGIGSTDPVDVTTPTPTYLTGVTQMAVGKFHACALTRDGSLWCWGDNQFGEVGDTTTTSNTIPERVLVTCP